MKKDTLNILANAISDVGSWYWWHINDDMVDMQFCDVQLYDESKQETHTIDAIAVRFHGHAFAAFLDNLEEEKWHEHLRDDNSILYPVDTYDLGFDNIKEAELLLNDYKNIIPIKDYDGLQKLSDAKHLLYGRCGDVGFVVGGDEIKIVGEKGQFTEEEIETTSRKWWDYWKDYWEARGTKDAYPKDYACEITIPVKED